MRRVAFHNLGCKVNAYETEAMLQQLEQKGYEIVSFEETADIYVINTCTVTSIADRKSRQMLHRARKKNPDALVVAVGCYVQADKARAEADTAVDLVIGNDQKSRLAELIETHATLRWISMPRGAMRVFISVGAPAIRGPFLRFRTGAISSAATA